MAKYHLKENGEPGVCRAQPGNCPKAPDSEHFSSAEDARSAFEKNMQSSLLERFEKYPNPSAVDEEFRANVARKRRIEDAVLHADPRKTVIRVDYKDLPQNWDGRNHIGFYVHPEFRKALPDDQDFSEYVLSVHLENELTDDERYSADGVYDEKSGIFSYSYRKDRNIDYGSEY